MTEATRAALLQLRAQSRAGITELERDLQSLIEASRSSNADDEHDPEGPTIAFERAQLSAMLDAARRHLVEAQEALRRLDDGTYGHCTGCSRPIPAQRLAARPAATTCVGCAGRR